MTAETETPKKRSCWKRGLLIAVCVLVVGGLLAFVAKWAFFAHLRGKLPEDAPRILLSADRFWLNETGVTPALFEGFLLDAGADLTEADAPAADLPARVSELLDGVDGIILAGGGDVDPERYGGDPSKASMLDKTADAFQLELIKQAKARGMPVLGVCRGLQILNVAHGGTLLPLSDTPDLHKKHFMVSHPLWIDPDSELAGILDLTHIAEVLSTHQQGLGRLGKGVQAVAWADEQRTQVEACRFPGRGWALGVMWHPERESFRGPAGQAVFREFIRRAGVYRKRRAPAH